MDMISVRRILAFGVPFLPLAILAIPDAFSFDVFLGEGEPPWYQAYTAIPWLVSALYAYPATAVTILIGGDVLSKTHVFACIVYAILVGFGLDYCVSRRNAQLRVKARG